MIFENKTKWTSIFVIISTVLFALSQLLYGVYNEELMQTLGQNTILINVRGAMNEYLLRYQISENTSDRRTNGGKLYFDNKDNLNSYFNEVNAFSFMNLYVNDRSWIFINTPEEFKELVSKEIREEQ